uniref:Uncharacterized protein n=1 Tax=Tetranychus urticae TaxID=32264 RepID=T1JXX6_TETUR
MNNNTGLSSSSTSGSGSLISTLVTSINQIPIEILSDKSLFDSIIGDNDLWSMVGDSKKCEILDKCLPNSFDAQEKEDTIRLLFNGQLKRFDDNPLDYIYFQLKLQRTSPDLLRTYDEVNRLKRRAYLIQEQKYQCKLLTEILTKRRILFEAAANSSPYGISPVTYQKVKSKLIPKNGNLSLRKRRKLLLRARKVKERYKMEIKRLFPEDLVTSDDDSDLELDVKPLRTKALHDDSINKTGPLKAYCDITSSRDEYLSTMKNFRRKRKALQNNESDDPVMDFSNITLSDIISRVANDSGDDICEKGLIAGDLKSTSPFTPKSPKLLCNSTSSLPLNTTSTSATTLTSINLNRIVSLLPNLSSAPLLSRQLSLQMSTSCQTGLGSSQSLLSNFESLSPPKKSQSTTILNVNSIKREPLDIFDFDNDSPPHSFPLPPLSLSSSTTSNPIPATSFSSLISQPHSPHISTSLPNVASIVSNSINDTPINTNTILATTIASAVTAIATTLATVTSTTTPLLIPATAQAVTTATTIPATMATYVQQQHPHQSKSQLTPIADQTILSTSKSTGEALPASFFSLIRDIFYISASNDRKLTLHKLEELVKEKLRLLDSKVSWSYEMVQSAMNYLSEVFPPPDMIPLVDYKEKNQLWQWIGVNRDSDDILIPLCNDWLEEKDKKKTTSLMDPSQPVPPAICPTNWTVRPSTEEEKKIYRDQEDLRYKKPHKAFTFTIHGYNSVVGPVKGCGIGSASPHAASPNKAREHSLLVKDRPPFVTLLSLVRDAAARLPNGEGTRADICELLKDSQYLLPTVSDQQVNAIVSGALDRLHYEKDPCVKYDVNRKVWIYLHRNRTETEFETLHGIQVQAAKAKRSFTKSQRKICSSSITQTPSISTTIGNFSRINVTNFSGKQPSAKVNKSALGSLTKTGESQSNTNTSTVLTSSSIQPTQQQKPPLTSSVSLAVPTPVSTSVSIPTTVSTTMSTSVPASMPTSIPASIQTSTTTSTFSLVSSSNQQPISFLSRSTPLKASSLPSPSSTNFNSIIPNLSLTTSSGITLNSNPISTLTTSTSSSNTPTTTTLPNINLSSSSLQRLSVGTSTLKKKAQRLKPVKKEPEQVESTSVSSNITAKPISYSSGTMTIAPMPASSQPLRGFEKIIPSHTALASPSQDTFTSLISSESGSQVKQIRPAKSVNSTMKVTSIISSSVANTAKNIDNVQHFLSLTTKTTSSLPSNITITSSATKPIAPKLGSSQSDTQQIIFPSTPGQTIFGKSILNPFEPKQPVTQTIQSSSQQQAASGGQHQILKPILPAPIQSQFQQQHQSDKQPVTKLTTTKHHQIQTQSLAQQIITLQPASIAATTQSQQITISKPLQAQQTAKPQQIQIHNQNISLASADGKQVNKTNPTQITLPKQIQIQGGSSTNLSTPTQISIPTSMLFGARPGSVVLATPGGKSYMMATSGGSIVLHPQVSGANTMQTTTNVSGSTTGVTNASTTSLAVRTLQGIRVIPVTTGIPVQRATGSSSLLGPNNSSQTPGVVPPHHVVARIITTNQSPHGSATQAQIVIPSTSTIQPILLASPQQLPNPSE